MGEKIEEENEVWVGSPVGGESHGRRAMESVDRNAKRGPLLPVGEPIRAVYFHPPNSTTEEILFLFLFF